MFPLDPKDKNVKFKFSQSSFSLVFFGLGGTGGEADSFGLGGVGVEVGGGVFELVPE